MNTPDPRLIHAKKLAEIAMSEHAGKILTTLFYQILEASEEEAHVFSDGETKLDTPYAITRAANSDALYRQIEDMLSMPYREDFPKHSIRDEIEQSITELKIQEWIADWDEERDRRDERKLHRVQEAGAIQSQS